MIQRVLRAIVWASAAAGIFMAFAWPFVISVDPDSALLRTLARATVVVLLLALSAAAVARARHAPPRG